MRVILTPRAAFPPQLEEARQKAAQAEGRPAPAPKAEAKLSTAQRIGLAKK